MEDERSEWAPQAVGRWTRLWRSSTAHRSTTGSRRSTLPTTIYLIHRQGAIIVAWIFIMGNENSSGFKGKKCARLYSRWIADKAAERESGGWIIDVSDGEDRSINQRPEISKTRDTARVLFLFTPQHGKSYTSRRRNCHLPSQTHHQS